MFGLFPDGQYTDEVSDVPTVANTLRQQPTPQLVAPPPLTKPNASPPPFRLRDVPRLFFEYMNREQGLWRKQQERRAMMEDLLLQRIIGQVAPEQEPRPKVQGLPPPVIDLNNVQMPQLPPMQLSTQPPRESRIPLAVGVLGR
jgi:hypothetical protein